MALGESAYLDVVEGRDCPPQAERHHGPQCVHRQPGHDDDTKEVRIPKHETCRPDKMLSLDRKNTVDVYMIYIDIICCQPRDNKTRDYSKSREPKHDTCRAAKAFVQKIRLRMHC